MIAGLGIAPAIACGYLLVDRLAPKGTVTEAFTWFSTTFLAGTAVGSAIAGVVVERAGVHLAFAGAGAIVFLGAILAGVGRYRLAPAEKPAGALHPPA